MTQEGIIVIRRRRPRVWMELHHFRYLLRRVTDRAWERGSAVQFFLAGQRRRIRAITHSDATSWWWRHRVARAAGNCRSVRCGRIQRLTETGQSDRRRTSNYTVISPDGIGWLGCWRELRRRINRQTKWKWHSDVRILSQSSIADRLMFYLLTFMKFKPISV